MLIDISKFRLNLTEFIEKVRFFGQHIILTKNGKEIAVISPIKDFKDLIKQEKLSELELTYDQQILPTDQETDTLDKLMHKKLLTVKEAIAILNISDKTLTKFNKT